jgi:hypothetical protein
MRFGINVCSMNCYYGLSVLFVLLIQFSLNRDLLFVVDWIAQINVKEMTGGRTFPAFILNILHPSVLFYILCYYGRVCVFYCMMNTFFFMNSSLLYFFNYSLPSIYYCSWRCMCKH